MGESAHAARREPATPEGALDLGGAASDLLAQARELSAGRSGRTLTPGAGAALKQTLLALTEGTKMKEHQAPGPATLQVILGRVTIGVDGDSIEVAAGQWAAIPDQRHDLEAVVDAVVMLTVATATD